MPFRSLSILVVAVSLVGALAVGTTQQPPPGLQFRVKIDPKRVGAKPSSGRVLVGVAKKGEAPDFTNYKPPVYPILGADAEPFAANTIVTLSAASDTFPSGSLNALPPGEYSVQAVFATNPDINLPDAPGNLHSEPIAVKLDPVAGTIVDLTLDKVFEEPPLPDDASHKYLRIPSKLLSDFHGRPMVYRVGVVLPADFDKEKDRKYALLVDVGGFGTRYTDAKGIEPDPRFVKIVPDGAGPFGDPYQVNSANNGPYGEALVTEVIPFIEKTFRCGGRPSARFTYGISTGGWVSFALQVFYADFFNGCWSQCPDSVTFERFELIDLYNDRNAYVNAFGFDRPGTRTLDGDVISTVRHECQLERVLGRGGRWELSGRDWACWNAVYGPRGKDGKPIPVWDGKTGVINKAVLDHWKAYDLKKVLEKHWATLGPKLAGGKIHIWVGDADDYFLNVAVHNLRDAVEKFQGPAFDGQITIEPHKGHVHGGWTRKEMLDAMAARAGIK